MLTQDTRVMECMHLSVDGDHAQPRRCCSIGVQNYRYSGDIITYGIMYGLLPANHMPNLVGTRRVCECGCVYIRRMCLLCLRLVHGTARGGVLL